MDVQLQVRQNALEAQEYMRDLFEWERKVKAREQALKSSSPAGAAQPAPAPRGRAGTSSVPAAPQTLQQPGLTASTKGSSTKPQPQPQQQQQQQQSRGGANAAKHTYSSYSKWDKLDVDAMLGSSSDEDASGSSSSKAWKGGGKAAAAQQQQQQQGTHCGSSTHSAQRGPSAAAPNQSPGSNAGAKVVPAARQPASAAPPVQVPSSSGQQAGTGESEQEAHMTPISSTYTPTHGQQNGATPSTTSAAPSHPPIRNSEPQTSEAWRARGNDLFKAGKHAYAKECYSRSIAMEPSSAVAFANRAMAELKLQEWEQAEEDCSHALRLDPRHVKALHRRGTARRQLGNVLNAAQDFEDALRLEPGNTAIAKDRDAAVIAHLAAAKLQMPSQRVRLPVEAKAPPPMPPPTQQHKQPQQQQPPPQPTSPSTSKPSPASKPEPTSKPAKPTPTPGLKAAATKTGPDGPDFPLDFTTNGPTPSNRSKAAEPPKNAASSRAVAAEGRGGSKAAQAPSAGGITDESGKREASGASQSEASRGGDGQQGGTAGDARSQDGKADAAADQQARSSKVAAAAEAAASQLHARALASTHAAPRTSTEFEAVWRSLKGDLGLQARYLGVIPPESLPSVFKASLTPQLLAAILRTLLSSAALGSAASPSPQQPSPQPAQQAAPGTASSAPHAVEQGVGGGSGQSGAGCLSAGQVVGLLKGLSAVPRLSMAAMCVPSRERAELRGMWERACECEGGVRGSAAVVSEQEWRGLQAAFKLG